MRVRCRSKRVRHLLHVGGRHQRPENPTHEREELNVARDERLQRGRIASLDVVVLREDLADQSLAAFLEDRAPHLDQAPVQRARSRLVVILPEGELDDRFLRPTGHRPRIDRQRSTDCGDERPACHRHVTIIGEATTKE
jgi:hypothetical protein